MNLRILTIITVFSLLLLAYPVWRIGQWLELSLITNLLITTPVFLSQFIARVALRHSKSRVQSFIKRLADLFLGFVPILLIQVVVAEVVLALSSIPSANAAIFILISSMLIGAAGIFIARFPRVVVISLKSDKVFRMQRFVQISDVHIGSRTSRFLEQIMNTIVDLDPDFLCITGDLIDQSGITIEQLKPLLKLDRPIYYCTGNHERYEDFEEIIDRLNELGVNVLRNRAMDSGHLQIIGIDDAEDKHQVHKVLPSIAVARDRYSILLYHRPQGLEAAHANGIDLKLSGHTHNGQIMPFNLLVNRVFEYTQGLYQHFDTVLYVNEGTGTWGPAMRVGTRGEITLFELSSSQ